MPPNSFKPIPKDEIEEVFSRASGPGGQHVNKVATRVSLRHRPTGISVSVQESRSQAANRQLARERLAEAVAQHFANKKKAAKARIEKQRRRSSPRPRALKRKILESKKQRADLKRQRKPPPMD